MCTCNQLSSAEINNQYLEFFRDVLVVSDVDTKGVTRSRKRYCRAPDDWDISTPRVRRICWCLFGPRGNAVDNRVDHCRMKDFAGRCTGVKTALCN